MARGATLDLSSQVSATRAIAHALLNMNESEYIHVGHLRDGLARMKEIKLHEEPHSRQLAAILGYQLGLSNRRAASCHQVIDDQHHIVLVERIHMHLKLVGPIFELVAFRANLSRQLSRLARRHEPRAKTISDGRTNEKASRFSTDNFRDTCILEVIRNCIYRGVKSFGLLQ